VGRVLLAMRCHGQNLSTPFAIDDRRLVRPALLAFVGIAKAWSLTEAEQSAILGQPMNAVLAALNEDGVSELRPDTLERVSYVLGIYRALHTIFPNQQQADRWVSRPNTAVLFEGAPALALLCSGRAADLAAVRQYLEAQGLENPDDRA